MKEDDIKISVVELRPALVRLFEYIPYFEERVGGTFKFQYWDEETGDLKDMKGYEESNRLAKFPDPVLNDETWAAFKRMVISDVHDKFFIYCKPPWEYVDTEYRACTMSEDKLLWLLNNLFYDVVHERLCTGYTQVCMEDGIYLSLLMRLKDLLAEFPDDGVITCQLTKYGKQELAKRGSR